MATTTLVRWVGARNPSIPDTLLQDGSAIDVSSDTVKFKMRAGGDPTAALVVDTAATFVTDGTNGQVEYSTEAAAVATAGMYVAWWEITSGGLTQDTGEFIIDVREHDTITNSLCELADLRVALELEHGEDRRLSFASELIGPASAKIMSFCQREFAPLTSAEARTFVVRGAMVDLAPYDLRTATTVKLHPEDAGVVTLTANEDYWLGPVPSVDSTSQWLRLWPGRSLNSTLYQRMGVAQLEITGDWGFATVPDLVTRACAITVASWMDKAVSEYGQFIDGDVDTLQPGVTASLALPRDAKMLLSEYCRVGVPA